MRKAKALSLFPIFLIGLALILVSGCGKKSNNPDTKPEWTILVYADGNNNLDYTQGGNSYCIQDIQDLQQVGSTENVNIIAMVSSLRTGGIAKYYYIEHYPDDLGDNISSRMLANKGTKDMSDPATLREFLNYGLSNYPAKKYMLIIDDHGGGWRGACEDEQNGSGNLMTMVDMATAIKQSLTAAGIDKFDVITFHACLMSMVEVAYELRNCANYLVASEFSMPMESVLGADTWLTQLTGTPTMSGNELANAIPPAVYQAGVTKQKIVHMAATDLSKMQRLAAKIDNFGTQLHTSAGDYWLEVLDAWLNTHTTNYDDPANVDLREFAMKVKQEPNLQNINLIRYACDSVISALNDAIEITNTNAPALPRGGLTIYMPYRTAMYEETNYGRLAFAQVGWAGFLSDFIGTIEQLLSNVTTISGTITWPGHTLSHPYAFLDTSHSAYIYGILPTPASTNGAYTMQFQLNGTLQAYIEAWDDLDNDGTIDSNEPLGYYDANNNNHWDDMLTLQGGQTITNANIPLFLSRFKFTTRLLPEDSAIK